MVGRLGPLHEAGQAMGSHKHWVYRVLSLGLKAKVPTMPPLFFSVGGLCLSSRGKLLCFKTLSMENCRLLIRICSNTPMARDVPMVHSMHLLKFHPYIYGGKPPKSMKLPIDSSSVTQSFFSLL